MHISVCDIFSVNMAGAVPVMHFQSALNCRIPGRTKIPVHRLQPVLKHFRLVSLCVQTLSVVSSQPEGILMGGGTVASGV